MIQKKVASLVAAAGLSIAASTASAFNAPFYACVGTPLQEFDGSVVDAAIATPALSTLVTAVTVAGLVDTLATTENITVFAPTDSAFMAVPAPILDEVLADTDVLTAVLTYHVVAGRQDPRRSNIPTTSETLQGQRVTYDFRNGEPFVNGATLSCQGVQTDNGVVWIIDSVLMPQYLPAAS